MTAQEWFDKTYSVENESLFELFKSMKFGTILLTIHDCKISDIQTSFKMRFGNLNNIKKSGHTLKTMKPLLDGSEK